MVGYLHTDDGKPVTFDKFNLYLEVHTMENIMNIYRNLNSNVRIIVNCIVFFAVIAIVDLPGFIWFGLIVGGIVGGAIIGAKAAYKQYVRMNNLPVEAGKWVDDRINNVTSNLDW